MPSVTFAVDHKSGAIQKWVEKAQLPYRTAFSTQAVPGIVPAIYSAANKLTQKQVIVCNSDEIRMGLNIVAAIKHHEQHDMAATMVATFTNHVFRHRLLVTGESGVILYFALKPASYKDAPENVALVNAGVLILRRNAFDYIKSEAGNGWSGLIDPLIEARQMSAYCAPGMQYFNVGTAEELHQAEAYLGHQQLLQ